MNVLRTSSGWIIILGVIGFISIVAYLQSIQKDYNPYEQQMSELAFGKYGSLMFFAFLSFSVSIFFLGIGLLPYGAPVILKSIIFLSSICMFGGGIFRLDNATNLHITLVSVAFILIVLSMYILPKSLSNFSSLRDRVLSYGTGIGTAISIALGQQIFPIGLGQRLAALFISLWLSWIGICLIRNKI